MAAKRKALFGQSSILSDQKKKELDPKPVAQRSKTSVNQNRSGGLGKVSSGYLNSNEQPMGNIDLGNASIGSQGSGIEVLDIP